MADRWLYTTSGTPAFYQQGQYLYSASSNSCDFFESDGWFYSMKDHNPSYYVSDGWLYTPQGGPAFYFGDT